MRRWNWALAWFVLRHQPVRWTRDWRPDGLETLVIEFYTDDWDHQ